MLYEQLLNCCTLAKFTCSHRSFRLEHGMPKRPLRDNEARKAKHGDSAVDELRVRRELRQTTPVLAALPWHTLQQTMQH